MQFSIKYKYNLFNFFFVLQIKNIWLKHILSQWVKVFYKKTHENIVAISVRKPLMEEVFVKLG